MEITRIFDAPIEKVWKAWTDKDALKRWWGPKGFDMYVKTLEFKPYGVFHYCMRGPDNIERWGKFTYKEIKPPYKITFINSFADKEGRPAKNPYIENWPLEVESELTLAEYNKQTKISLKGHPINASEQEIKTFEDNAESMQKGFEGTWEQLDKYLEEEQNEERAYNRKDISGESRRGMESMD